MSVFTVVVWGQPLGFWLVAFGLWLFLSIRRYRRDKERQKRWNPFLDMNSTKTPITCPLCHAAWPGGYEPLSHREHMWKGVVCPNCRCEYDDRGRERTG